MGGEDARRASWQRVTLEHVTAGASLSGAASSVTSTTSTSPTATSTTPLPLPTSTPTPTSTIPPPPERTDPSSSFSPSIAPPPLTHFNPSTLQILLSSSLQILLSSSLQCLVSSPSTTLPQPTAPSTTTIQLTSIGSSNAVHINRSTSHHPNSIRYTGGVNSDSSSYSSTKYWRYRLGGVVGLSVVALIVWFFLRKRRQSEVDEFDGNFEPARVVSTHNRDNRFDLDDGQDPGPGGAGITPYPFQPEMSQHSARPSMDQRPLIGAAGAAAAVGAYNPQVMVIFLQENKEALLPGVDATTPPHGTHGSPPPPPGTTQSDGRHTTSDPSPNAALADHLGHGPSPGPSVPPSEVGSSGHGYETFGVGTARLSAREREENGVELYLCLWLSITPTNNNNQQQQQQCPRQCPRSSASPPLPSHSLAPSTSTPSPPPPGWAEGEKAAMLGRSEAAVGIGMIVHQDAGKVAEEERSGGEEIPPTYDSLPFGELR
ncbi:hypothetical protein D9756_000028 [Leucocoprinus leucothites]|uniref:Uncharacterized protein n=1 Tax=Leucocoprinus leucothites TaxID=201217 RepID=A0A8H5GFS2_9AGAR|nr:hypothetical protein D9756_000028 [Leucoagaricus leucothites]